ncbi:MAG: RNA-binding cell elongation regulator Jag/EloR [Acidimicrobiales bacterium]
MEWVETTGKTVEEAKDAALDQLGVDEQDAEFEVVEEPRTGLFGRTRGEARVRARVRPTQPRPKVERRDRRGRPAKGGRAGGGRRQGGERSSRAPKAPAATAAGEKPANAKARATADAGAAPVGVDAEARTGDDPEGTGGAPAPGGQRRRRRGGRGRGPRSDGPRDHDDDEQESRDMSEAELAEQGEVVRGFLVDLLDAFGLDGEVTATPAEEGAVELEVAGDDLGLLIGPKGATLQAVQELSRSMLQRTRPGETHARIRVDVSGYRARRREALEAFVQKVAADVVASGVQKALEPMAPPDRKVVHDTVNDIPGVHTVSEGEDTRRRVVIIPD